MIQQRTQRLHPASRPLASGFQRTHVWLQVNERAVKAEALRRFREHALASRATTAAGVILLWQRPFPVLHVLAVWRGAEHQVAKLQAWRRWRSAATRRVRFKVLQVGSPLRSGCPDLGVCDQKPATVGA